MSENLKTEDLPVVLAERFLRAMYYATNLSFLRNQLLQMRILLYMILMLLEKTVIFNVFIRNSLFLRLAQQTSCLVFITFITSYLLIDNNTQRCLSRVKLGLRRSWTHCLLVHSCSYLVKKAATSPSQREKYLKWAWSTAGTYEHRYGQESWCTVTFRSAVCTQTSSKAFKQPSLLLYPSSSWPLSTHAPSTQWSMVLCR